MDSQWQSIFYRPYGKHIYDMPITSIITRPTPEEHLENNSKNKKTIPFKGFAYSGGGRGVLWVELSLDNGENWYKCRLEHRNERVFLSIFELPPQTGFLAPLTTPLRSERS